MSEKRGIKKENVDDILQLTAIEEGILFQYLANPYSNQYMEQLRINISGEIDSAIFKKAWSIVLDNNEVLRSVYIWKNMDKPIQVILKKNMVPIIEYDLTAYKGDALDLQLKDILKKDINERIDISVNPFRIKLCKLDYDNYEIIITSYHILYDGWSNGIIIKEFLEAYNNIKTNKNVYIKSKKKYKTYKKWLVENNKDNDGKLYWSNYLKEITSKAQLPASKTKKVEIQTSDNYKINISRDISEKIQAFTKSKKISIASFMYGAWAVLLHMYGNSDDIVFGTTVSGRDVEMENIDDVVGLFINTIPLRVLVNKEISVSELLKCVNSGVIDRHKYEKTPLTEINKYAALEKKESLFDSIMVIENYPLDKAFLESSSTLKVNFIEMNEMTNYDITACVSLDEEIEIKLIYNEEIFNKSIIETLANHYINIIKEFISKADEPIANIEMMTESEKEKIICDFNNTEFEFEDDITVHELFERQVKKTPNNIAVKCGNLTMTYKELNDRANSLSRVLRKKGVKADSIVGIMVDRSFEMMVGIYAILKAGGAYMPIDYEYPDSRKEYMLQNSNCEILLTKSRLIKDLNYHREIINLEDESLYEELCDNLTETCTSNNLAYVIYTSGSTGKPKGVMIEHKSIINRINWMHRSYPIGEKDVILQKTTYTFDVSVWELLWWSFVGASVSLLPHGDEKNIDSIVECIKHYNVTVLHFVPSMLNIFIEYVIQKNLYKEIEQLEKVFSSGEALKVEQINKFNMYIRKRNSTKLINLYGPTEAAVDVTCYECNEIIEDSIVPIGKPIDNIKLYIIDDDKMILPIGVAGELCIGGVGLARGYLNNEELTKEKFIDSPFESGERIYKTGDLARWLPDGNIEFLGRRDHQVKIRGFRIELGEIENALVNIEEIKDAVVIVRERESNKDLYAYYTSDVDYSNAELKNLLKEKLPYYMIPAYFIKLETIPLMPNGKVNRKAILQMDVKMKKSNVEYEAPKNETEEKLYNIWRKVLGRDDIGINENFFDVGGNSILLLRVHSQIEKDFKINISVSDLFSYATIHEISEFIISFTEEKKENIKLKYITVTDEYLIKDSNQLSENSIQVKLDKNLIEKIDKIDSKEEIQFSSILLSCFMYLLSETLQEEEIQIETLLNNDKRLKSININMDSIEDFGDLFHSVDNILLDRKKYVYDLEDLKKVANIRKSNEVSLLFYDQNLSDIDKRYLEFFDLTIEIKKDENNCVVLFEFNPYKLNSNKVKLLVNRYIKLIKILLERYLNRLG